MMNLAQVAVAQRRIPCINPDTQIKTPSLKVSDRQTRHSKKNIARPSHYKHAHAVNPSGGTSVRVYMCVCTENVTFLAKELKILLICINPKLQHTFIPGPTILLILFQEWQTPT